VVAACNLGSEADAGRARFDECLGTMFETYRMLGQDHGVELERLAQTSRRVTKPRGLRLAARQTTRLPATFLLALIKLTGLAR
jgi:hypothetical protein